MNNEKCEFAERPFSRSNPGLCGEPATHTICSTDPKPFRCCEKHFHAMVFDSPKLTPAKAMKIIDAIYDVVRETLLKLPNPSARKEKQ